ncbi:MAG: TldD/PmbA family protein [Acidimicrobiia bacterium]|nr:TldD/PmbA family protein [Acidimicrobiia bacterium]
MSSRPELLDLATRIASSAAEGEQVEVCVARRSSTAVRAYDGAVESFTSADTFGIGVRVVSDHRVGFASAGTLDEGVVAEVLADARDNARFAEPDEHAGVAEPDGVAPVPVDLWRPALPAYGAADKIERAIALERAVRAADPRIAGVRVAAWGDSFGESAVATSTGIAQWSRATGCHLSVQALARDGAETQTGVGSTVGREPDELDFDEAVADAVDRATRLLGATKISTRRIALILEPRMAASVIGIVAGTLCGEPVTKGRSPFADREGDAIAAPVLTLVDDPTDHRSLGAESHDGEGLATRRNVLLDAGRLQGFLLDSTTGRRLGRASTGSAVRSARSMPGAGVQALALEPGDGSWDDLLARYDGALVVQAMTGLHSGVNPVSGDFSVGVEGMLVGGGEALQPVREVTVASTLQRLLLDVVAVGADLEWLPSGDGFPTVVVGEVSLSGN